MRVQCWYAGNIPLILQQVLSTSWEPNIEEKKYY